MERHYRRLDSNLSAREEMEWFCHKHNIKFRVRNDGHHWQFKKNDKLIEWWPSSAKLVVFQQWDRGVHVFDWQQVQRLLVQHGFAYEEPIRQEVTRSARRPPWWRRWIGRA